MNAHVKNTTTAPLRERIARVAKIAAQFADDVDKNGRFPDETMQDRKSVV